MSRKTFILILCFFQLIMAQNRNPDDLIVAKNKIDSLFSKMVEILQINGSPIKDTSELQIFQIENQLSFLQNKASISNSGIYFFKSNYTHSDRYLSFGYQNYAKIILNYDYKNVIDEVFNFFEFCKVNKSKQGNLLLLVIHTLRNHKGILHEFNNRDDTDTTGRPID